MFVVHSMRSCSIYCGSMDLVKLEQEYKEGYLDWLLAFQYLTFIVRPWYFSGLLTEKGYRKKKMKIELQILEEEFKIGRQTGGVLVLALFV